MGLFSSSTKYFAHAGSSVLIEEETRKDTVKGLMLQATIDSSSSLADAVKMGLMTNMYARARSMMRYAAKPDGYALGFPETDQDVLIVPPSEVQSAIEADEGEPIENLVINTGATSSGNLLSAALGAAYTNSAYFPWPDGNPVNPYNPAASTLEIPIADPDAVLPEKYYYAANPPDYTKIYDEVYDPEDGEFIPPTWTGDYRVTFSYADTNGDSQTWVVPQDLTPATSSNATITANYNLVSDPGTTLTWSYEVGSGGYPAIDAASSSESLEMQYLPIIMLMHDTKWFDELGDQNLEDTTDSILRRLALDPYDMKEQYIEQVTEAIENGDRPGEKKLDDWDFFVQFAVPLHSHIRGSREYMYEYFKSIQHAMPTRGEYESFLSSGGQQPYGEIHITEYGEQGYNAFYRYSYIASRTVQGEYTPPGWTAPLRHNRAYSKIYKLEDVDYADGIEEMHGAGAAVASTQGDDEEHSYIIITRQRSTGGVPSFYQILVMGPSMKYVVNTRDDPNKVGEYRDRDVEIELFPEDLEEESEFKIPVHYASLKAIPAMHREEMLQDALCATVYLVEKEKVKWYQKSFFKWLIVIIVIVVIIIAQQYHLLTMIKELAVAAFAVGATATAVAYAALYVVMSFALGFLISFAGSLIGGDLGQLFVIVASIYMMGGTQIFNNIGGTWTNMTGNFGWGTATSFLSAIKPIVDIGSTIVNRMSLADLESDMRDFEKTAKEKYEELRDAYDQLGDTPSWLDPMDLVQIFTSQGLGESPDSYFARTLNANPGTLGYDLVNNFSEVALMLPKEGNEGNMIDAMFNDMARQRGAA